MSSPAVCAQAESFLRTLPENGVDLFVLDPPYYGIVSEDWDNAWKDEERYLTWMLGLLELASRKLALHGSLLMFGGIGKHGAHPFWKLCMRAEAMPHFPLCYRNMVTWKKRRAYGKSHDYLFCREEIAWFSKSAERTEVTFNIPLTDQLRGYAGFSKKYPAKSEFKRVSNVWDDIPELMRPTRSCEKPLKLYDRLIETHSKPGDLIVDFFLGTGNSGVSALAHGRRFLGCDQDAAVVEVANAKMANVHAVVAAEAALAQET